MLYEYLKHWDEMLHHARSGNYDKAVESELKYHEKKREANPTSTKERPNIPGSKFGRKRHYDIYIQMDNMHKQIRKVNEDAPVNCAGGGAVAAIGVGPDGEPPKKTKTIKRFKNYKGK